MVSSDSPGPLSTSRTAGATMAIGVPLRALREPLAAVLDRSPVPDSPPKPARLLCAGCALASIALTRACALRARIPIAPVVRAGSLVVRCPFAQTLACCAKYGARQLGRPFPLGRLGFRPRAQLCSFSPLFSHDPRL